MLARRSRAAPALAGRPLAPSADEGAGQGRSSIGHGSLSQRMARPPAVERALQREIGRRRRAEADLERARRDLEIFAYSLAHDLRTPLQAVSGFTQILLEEQRSALGAHGELLERIAHAGARMQSVIDQMLAFAQPRDGEIDRYVVDLSRLGGEIAEQLQAEHPSRQVDWVIDPGLRCACNRELLREALTHLLSNSWKYTASKERPRIEFGAARIRGVRRLFVRDNGIGFTPSTADARRLPVARSDPQAALDGLGIGLPTARRIIERHGGSLEAAGGPGQGAVFCFTLGSPIECENERRIRV